MWSGVSEGRDVVDEVVSGGGGGEEGMGEVLSFDLDFSGV